MTVQEMIIDLWELIGEPTDLDPYTASVFDLTTDGAVKMLGWINRGYKRVLFWKFKDGSQIRFPTLERNLYFQTPLIDGAATEISSATATTVVFSKATMSSTDDYYNGWVVEIDGGTGSGQKALIVDYTGATKTATVYKAWATNPDTTSTFEVYKGFMKLVGAADGSADDNIVIDPISGGISVLKLTDVTDATELDFGMRTDTYVGNQVSPADPTEFVVNGNTLFFNTPANDNHWYKVEYMAIPANLTAVGDQPDMPEYWHEAVLKWAHHHGLQRQQEMEAAYSVKRDLFDLMATAKQPIETSFERSDSRAVIKRY